MKVKIQNITHKEKEQVIIECVEITPEVEQIQSFVLSSGLCLSGMENGKIYQLPIDSIFYFEAVDEHVFAYSEQHVYEIRQRLYEVESLYRNHFFLRCSKSVVINLLFLSCISPTSGGRFLAHMKNGEKLIISRRYVPSMKQFITGNFN